MTGKDKQAANVRTGICSYTQPGSKTTYVASMRPAASATTSEDLVLTLLRHWLVHQAYMQYVIRRRRPFPTDGTATSHD